jgi:hypothetical protein
VSSQACALASTLTGYDGAAELDHSVEILLVGLAQQLSGPGTVGGA